MREHERVTRLQIRRNIHLVHFPLNRIGQREHDRVGLGAGFGGGHHLHTVSFGLRPALAARIETDAHIDTAVAQIQGMGMTLAAIAKNRNLLRFDVVQICLVFVVDFRHCDSSIV